ncbi:MAG: recombination protein RecR [Chloroflexi bacterium]|nr:recombination protein RecR [Chloroflexota bacterium]
MRIMPLPVERLIDAFARLPGIGPKTASRLTFFLLRSAEAEALELARALQDMRRGTGFCSNCFNITAAGIDPCNLCQDETRDADLICVVEEPLDVIAIEKTSRYHGRYHVLHGAISPVEGVGPDDLRIDELIARLSREGFKEIILAMNPTMEGEATAMFLKRRVEGIPVRVTRLARGLPSGGDLEYADANTISQALDGRQEM